MELILRVVHYNPELMSVAFNSKQSIRIILNMFVGQLLVSVGGKEPSVLFECKSLKTGPIYPAVSLTNKASCRIIC